MSTSGRVESGDIRLRFKTREDELQLSDNAAVLIPTTFRRYQLSQYINSQLDLGAPVPFEFLINGSFLRNSIEDFLAENGISTETTLEVEYVRARVPPRYVTSFEHDDWVSSVHSNTASAVSSAESAARIVTGSYDGRIRVWNTTSQIMATSGSGADGGHLSHVKSARFITPTQLVSASFDRTVKLWKYSEDGKGGAEVAPQLDLYGHKNGVESVAASRQTNRLLTASLDHTVGLWSTRKSDAPAAPENLVPRAITKEGKRRKLNPSVSVAQRGPLALMQGHTAPVTQASFDERDQTVGYSTSHDHTVRTWDLVTNTLVDTRTTNNPLLCIEQMPSLNLLATGSTGRDVKLVDPRDNAAAVVAMTLREHKNKVVTLSRDPHNDYILASGSHDGTCRIWDLRSTKSGKDGVTGQSIFSISRESLQGKPAPVAGEGIKVFSVYWDSSVGLLSAGEDKAVQVNSGDNIT